ncbi:MAG: radical SAM family heme chaperone HemW [Bacteroidales bacterium]|nr:radical SAM family heme chaperone HemW [Bacteroidales bacterium]MBP3270331.1 radical SAM family heme chaperone HemW [Bacteroidales bacterium]
MIYLHVPFCESRCTYCGFFSNVILSEAQGNNENNENVILSEAKNLCYEAFADAVLGEIDDRREEIEKTLSVNTLYIGGGTPSVLPLDVLSRIVRTIESVSLSQSSNDENVILSDAKNLYPWSEFTIEVNPEDIIRKGDKYVKGLLALGVNRVSMGVQSFDDGILRWMNRRHDSAGAEEAFRILRRCGVSNISIDLIFGLPQLTDSVFEDTVGKALALGPEHISAYQLSVVEDSALAKMVATGRFTEASEERCRSQYDLLCARLAEAGYHHYEVSNFALPGREAVHNSAYWRRVPYVGLGPGAHSFSGGSVRSWNSGNLPVRLKDGSLKTYSREEEHLTDEDIRVERIMLALRTDAGLPEEELRSLAGDPSVVDRLLSDGALVRMGDPSVTSFPQDDKEEKHCHPEHSHCHPERSEGSLRISESHFFVSDEIIREII